MELYNNILDVLLSTKQKTSENSLKRRSRADLDAAASFTCLALNARPSFLYDHGKISIDLALEIARRLAKDIEALHDVVVLEFAQDIIFSKLDSLIQHLHQAELVFIDAGSENLTVVSGGFHVTHLLNVCQEWKTGINSHNLRLAPLTIADSSELSGPAVIGILLAYPVVYYIQTETNSLGCRPLLLTKCELFTLVNTNICSFSVPVESISPEITASLARWRKMFLEAFETFNLKVDVTESVESLPVLAL